jgi:hypothetical protein
MTIEDFEIMTAGMPKDTIIVTRMEGDLLTAVCVEKSCVAIAKLDEIQKTIVIIEPCTCHGITMPYKAEEPILS